MPASQSVEAITANSASGSGLHSVCLRHLLGICCFRSRVPRRFSMRLSPVYLYLAGSALLLSGCGTSNHIGCSGTDACVAQSFVYATTHAGQVLIFPAVQNGT